MTQRHVRQLMSHHGGQLRFIVSGFNYPAIDEHETAGKREGIDGLVIDAMKFPQVFPNVFRCVIRR